MMVDRWPPSPEGISIVILGDAPFYSPQGKTCGYLVGTGEAQYLLDIGAPPFGALGPEILERVRGILQTHVHDDHKRWFTDFALYHFYDAAVRRAGRVRLYTVEKVHEEMRKNAKAALERTLSPDSRRVIDLDYETFIEPLPIGPRQKFRIELVRADGGLWERRVVDGDGRLVPPEKAKVVISREVPDSIPRMLFYDERDRLWVEPESYYPYSSSTFYESDRRDIVDEAQGLRIRARKSASWHGLPIVGYELLTARERVFFPSDTVFDYDLWQELCTERRPMRLEMTGEAFLRAGTLYGNINDFIERTWSRERFATALELLSHGAIVHDAAGPGSVVHTNYAKLLEQRDRLGTLLLTHCPDNFVTLHPMAAWGKTYRVRGAALEERVGDGWVPMTADVYVRGAKGSRVGFRAENGAVSVVRGADGCLCCVPRTSDAEGELLFHVDLYEDVQGAYVPAVEDPDVGYRVRTDGRIERVRDLAEGSEGTVTEDRRPGLTAGRDAAQ